MTERDDTAAGLSPRLASLSLLLLVLVAHQPSLSGGFIWDDDDYVTENETLRDVAGLRQIWLVPGAVPQYYPLVHATFWLEYQLWGLNPFGYHAVNLLLHAATAILLYLLLQRLQLRGAWLAAALFAVHPVQVETVAWVTERKNLLSGCLFAAGLLAYLHFADRRDRGACVHRWHALALMLYVLALLSKTIACSLPAVILVLFWWQRRPTIWRHASKLVPFFVIGIGLAMVTIWMERVSVGAGGSEFELGLWQRVLIAGRALWFYLGKLCLPWPLSFVYPRWQPDPGSLLQWLWPLTWLGLLIAVVSVKRARGAAAALLIFSGVLFPALGFIDVYPMRYAFVADHFQYHACAAILALVAAAIAAMPRRAMIATATIALCALAAISRGRGPAFDNPESLWRDTLAKNPQAWIAHNNLGVILAERGEQQAAIDHFRRVLELKPDHYSAHTNLGRAYTALGDPAVAAAHFQQALEIEPGDHRILIHLGNLYASLQQTEAAEAAYLRAAQLAPGTPDPHINLGSLYAQAGRVAPARDRFDRALALDPDNPGAHFNLGNLQRDTGEVEAALVSYQRAGQLDAGNLGQTARYNRAALLRGLGRSSEAIAAYRELLALADQRADVWYDLGCLLDAGGDPNGAADAYRSALAAAPTHAGAANNLGTLYAAAGRRQQAAACYRQALAARPEHLSAHRNLADVLAADGALAEAISHYRSALAGNDATTTKVRLAWVLATAPASELRQPAEALALAEAAVAAAGGPAALDALAAACAANGDFGRAAKVAAAAAAAAQALGAEAIAAAIARRQQGYSRNEVYHGPVPW